VLAAPWNVLGVANNGKWDWRGAGWNRNGDGCGGEDGRWLGLVGRTDSKNAGREGESKKREVELHFVGFEYLCGDVVAWN
jgi:hypothetical protein